MTTAPIIHWFRRDLRLQDNTALAAALNSGAPVLPLFVFDDAILKSPRSGAPRMAFLLKALASLDQSLRASQSRLVMLHGEPLAVLAELIRETGAQAVYLNRDYSPFAARRDAALADHLRVPVHQFDDHVLSAPGQIMTADQRPYTVYTPFKKQWKLIPKPALVQVSGGVFYHDAALPQLELPSLNALGFPATIEVPPASEEEARRRLRRFVSSAIYAYGQRRNDLAPDPFFDDRSMPTSCLSPYLRFGLLSPRQAYWEARGAYQRAESSPARDSVEIWIDELIWREFYIHILHHFPHVDRGSFRREYDALQWRWAPDDLQAWKDGRTGYPVVDAAMRQLQAVGWLPNRARMIVASFLTKDLLIDWHEGELHFMQCLIDGDLASNNGGWQWTAGTGTDAQPYFRIFNPVSQSQKFDPQGVYIRRWLPELSDVPDDFIHSPWLMDSPPRRYPAPIVDHHAARERTLAAYHLVKGEL